jgi:hypothetical protein
VSDTVRIGEILLLRERIDPVMLTQALKQQAATRQRLVSLLVNRALLDPDDGALMLSEQLGYPAAMQRHLERRDPALASLIPAPLGARWVVLPLARARTGALVVVARDPTTILAAALEHATKQAIVLAVTPAVQIERMVRAAYGAPAGGPEEPLPVAPPTLSDLGDMRFEDTPPPQARSRTISMSFEIQPELPPVRLPRTITPIDKTLGEIDRAITLSAVERLVMAHAAKRWRAALLMAIGSDQATGLRGHGAALGDPAAISLPLAVASQVQVAYESHLPTRDLPVSPVQQHLASLLASSAPAAAPVLVANRVHAVLTVGDPVDDTVDTLGEIDKLVDALGAAYVRFGG